MGKRGNKLSINGVKDLEKSHDWIQRQKLAQRPREQELNQNKHSVNIKIKFKGVTSRFWGALVPLPKLSIIYCLTYLLIQWTPQQHGFDLHKPTHGDF